MYALNLNGLSLDRSGGQFDTLCSFAEEFQMDVVCGREYNFDTTKPAVRSILNHDAWKYWNRTRLQTGSTYIDFTNQAVLINYQLATLQEE